MWLCVEFIVLCVSRQFVHTPKEECVYLDVVVCVHTTWGYWQSEWDECCSCAYSHSVVVFVRCQWSYKLSGVTPQLWLLSTPCMHAISELCMYACVFRWLLYLRPRGCVCVCVWLFVFACVCTYSVQLQLYYFRSSGVKPCGWNRCAYHSTQASYTAITQWNGTMEHLYLISIFEMTYMTMYVNVINDYKA